MLIILVLLLDAFLLLYIFGRLSLNFYNFLTKTSENISIDYIILTGLILLSIFLTVIHFFFPINLYVFLLVNTFVFIVGFFFYKTFFLTIKGLFKKINSFEFLFTFLLLTITILFLSSIQSQCYDTGLYHSQIIKWINQYPLIPGLGNLHERFAFNNNSFIIQAFFNQNIFSATPVYILNSLLLFLIAYRCLYKITLYSKNANHFDLIIVYSLILFFILFYFSTWISSASVDLTVLILVLYLFILIIDNTKSITTNYSIVLLFSICIYLITIKISTILFLFIIPFYILTKKEKKKSFILLFIFFFIILIPFFIRNYYLSGYLIFPSVFLDLFHTDWKIDTAKVLELNKTIIYWARIPYVYYQEIISLSFSEWIRIWWKNNNNEVKTLLFIYFISPFIIVLTYKKLTKSIIWLWLIVFFLGFPWFLNTPDIRFHLPTFAIITLISSMAFIQLAGSILLDFKIYFFLFIFSLFLFFTKIDKSLFFSNLFLPQQMPSVENIEYASGNLIIPVVPDLCYNSELPCIPLQAFKQNLFTRTDNIKDGFFLKNTSSNLAPYYLKLPNRKYSLIFCDTLLFDSLVNKQPYNQQFKMINSVIKQGDYIKISIKPSRFISQEMKAYIILDDSLNWQETLLFHDLFAGNEINYFRKATATLEKANTLIIRNWNNTGLNIPPIQLEFAVYRTTNTFYNRERIKSLSSSFKTTADTIHIPVEILKNDNLTIDIYPNSIIQNTNLFIELADSGKKGCRSTLVSNFKQTINYKMNKKIKNPLLIIKNKSTNSVSSELLICYEIYP